MPFFQKKEKTPQLPEDQIRGAFIDYIMARTWQEKMEVVKERRAELLEGDSGYLTEIFVKVTNSLIQGGDDDVIILLHWSVLNDCRKKDIDTVFNEKKDVLFMYEPSRGSLISRGSAGSRSTEIGSATSGNQEVTMSGKQFAKATYKMGHTRLGERNIDVWLVAHSSGLILRQRNDSRDILIIPWTNIELAEYRTLYKEGLAREAAFALRGIPLLGSTSKGDQYYNGVQVAFWDDDHQRNQMVFLDTKNRRNAKKVARQIWEYRDTYVHALTQTGDPA